ncbi:MAG: IS1634 family transposase [Colwellia sp.]|nr:IS1634 family transposase [Colwellia sp.]
MAHKKQNGKSYRRVLLRQNYRQEGKVKHRTIANLSKCTDEEIKAIKLALKFKGDLSKLGSFRDSFHSKQGLSIGAIFLIKTIAERLHIITALGKTLQGKLALWQIMARIIEQGSRLSAVRLAQSHAVCDLLNVPGFSEDDLYRNLDWLCENQGKIEKKLFLNRYKSKTIPRLFLYDVTSSYLEGVDNELADWGYNRDGKKGKLQIVIGLLTDAEGVPVSVEVFKGNINDTKTFLKQIKKLAERFKVQEVTMVGDRGMIKSAQIENLKEENFNYITCITKPQIESLLKKKTIQMELFNEKVCEVEHDGIRYIVRKNPIRRREIEKTRFDKIKKIEHAIEQQNNYLAEHKKAFVEVAVRKINKQNERLKVSDFAKVKNKERRLSLEIDQDKKEEATKLDGCYVVKTDLKKEFVSAETIHRRYKELALVERGFRTMKTGLLETRPVFVRKEKRTRGHVFIVMLAYSIIHELQNLWAELDVTVEEGITELATIDSMEMTMGETSYHQIPEPRERGKELLRLANVILPPAMPCNNIKVATKRKLPQRRKNA